MHQDKIIRAFISHLNSVLGTSYKITRWPDKNPTTNGEIDAYAEDGSLRPLAIEHTLVETYRGQKESDHRFLTVMANLEESIDPDGPFSDYHP
ncbi:MAG: hypothetical protein JRI41_08355 [Deltaproteobacteria bacterium]|nr:hypothetical protein [Deltaproteobacteria bacterium]